jgi:tRNA(fMet)-specific endonuclease VapC
VSVILLDTTFLIDTERKGLDLDAVIDDDDDVAMAAITVAELQVGVELASTRHRAGRESLVAAVVSSIPVLAYDLSVATEHSKLLAAVRKAGRPRGAHDLIIAATARAAGRSVVTADPGAFEGLPGVDVRGHS